MARAQKHTRTETRTVTEEVTTYTLELSQHERDHLVTAMSFEGTPAAKSIIDALESSDATDPAPLAVGDRVRVLRDYRQANRDRVQTGSFWVSDPELNTWGEFQITNWGGNKARLPADGEGTIWERAS